MTKRGLELGADAEDLAQTIAALKEQVAKLTAERDEARGLAKSYEQLCREQRLELESLRRDGSRAAKVGVTYGDEQERGV